MTSTRSQYFVWILVATLLWVVWHHAHWSVALALAVLFVWHGFRSRLINIIVDDIFLYLSEYWRVRMCPEEAVTRITFAKHIYNGVNKERLEALEKYNKTVRLYSASIKRRPDDPIPAIEDAKECLVIAGEKLSRAYDNLKAAGGE